MLKFRKIAPGSYEATGSRRQESALGYYYVSITVEVYRNCDCGKCPAWVVLVREDGYEMERFEQFDTKRDAVAFAQEMDI